MDGAFLPGFPLALSQPAVFGALLALGLLVGEALRRYARLPRITGYVLTGLALGPHGLGWLSDNALFDLRLLVDLSIGLVVFELGSRLDFGWLRRNRWLFAGALAESFLAFWAIFLALLYFDFRPTLAAIAAAIGTATSPAVALLVAQDLRADGQVTERMLLFTAVNTVFAQAVLALLLPFLHFEHQAQWHVAFLHPLYLFAGGLALGLVAAAVMLRLAGWLGKREELQFVLMLAVIVAAIGLAHSLKLSVVVALLALGMLTRNLDSAHVLVPVRFGHGTQLFFVILFILTGASLDLRVLGVAAGAAIAAYVVMRFLGKALAILLFARPSGLAPGSAGLLAVALVPMSGLAVVMVRDTASLYPSFGRELAAVVLSAVVILELLGPLATQFALQRAREAHPHG